MTVTVAGHRKPGPTTEAWVQALQESLAESIGELDESAAMIEATFDQALQYAEARCVLDPRAATGETWEAVVTALQVGAALFAVTNADEGTVVRCRIDHEDHALTAVGPGTRIGAHVGRWTSVFWLAVVCRDRERMRQLCGIPLDRLRPADGETDAYAYHWVAALQAYCLRRSGLVEELSAAIADSHPDRATVTPRDLLDRVLYQPINMFVQLVRKDGEKFGTALAEAVDHHRSYWTADERRARSTSGVVALGPLAIACLAYDANSYGGEFVFDVETDYLPRHLLEGSWVGEFPT